MIDRTKPRFRVTGSATKECMWFVFDAKHNDITATCSDQACALRIAKHFNYDGGGVDGWEERREGKADRREAKPIPDLAHPKCVDCGATKYIAKPNDAWLCGACMTKHEAKPTDADRIELLYRKMGPEPVKLNEPQPEQTELERLREKFAELAGLDKSVRLQWFPKGKKFAWGAWSGNTWSCRATELDVIKAALKAAGVEI